MKPTITMLVCLSVLCSGAMEPSQTVASGDQAKETFSAGVLGIAVGSIVVVGTGGFFLVRNIRNRAAYRDSLVNAVEEAFFKGNEFLAEQNYSQAAQKFSYVLEQWQHYLECKRKDEFPAGIDSASIHTTIVESRFLHDQQESVVQLKRKAFDLPQTETALVEHNRHEINRKKVALKEKIELIRQQNPQFQHLIDAAYGPSMEVLYRIDTMFVSVYEKEQLNFDLKTRFFYNMAMKSNDTTRIREFVLDCEYYQIERTWCEEARLAMGESQPVVLSSSDSLVQAEFIRAMDSRLIQNIAAFIEKYSGKDAEQYQEYITSAAEKIKQLKKEMEVELAYSRSHPFFVNADLSLLNLSFADVPGEVQTAVENYIAANSGELRKITNVRFPADISFDLSGNNPTLMLTGFISAKRDLVIDSAAAPDYISVPGAVSAMAFLARMYPALAQGFEAEQVYPAITIVRLRKDINDYITLYARLDGDDVQWYEFIDLTLGEKQNVRIPEQALPTIFMRTDELIPKFFEIME